MPSTTLVGDLFNKYTATTIASPQKYLGRFLAFIMLHAMATTIWFLLSTTPFCCGEYGAVSCRYTPVSAQ
jgi:hypothetical protein